MKDRVRSEMFPGLFAPLPAAAAPAATAPPLKPGHCIACGHGRKAHCKPGTTHGRWRYVMGQPNPGDQLTRTSAHCNEPLCSCTSFAAAVAELKPGQRPGTEAWEGSSAQARWAAIHQAQKEARGV